MNRAIFEQSWRSHSKIVLPEGVLAHIGANLQHMGWRLAAMAHALATSPRVAPEQQDVAALMELRKLQEHGEPDARWYELEIAHQRAAIAGTGRITLIERAA